jgi:hypothetical protein
MARGVPAVAALAALLIAAPSAVAQTGQPVPAPTPSQGAGGAFGPLPPARTTPAPTPTIPSRSTPNSRPNDQQVSTLGVLGLFVAGVLVILAIGYFIARDARRSTRKAKRKAKGPPKARPATAGGGGRPPPRRPSAAARKRRRRQKRRAR